MAMRWDPVLAAATARELDRTLHRARGRALLLDAGARRVLLFLREHTLVLELHPQKGWISLLPAAEPPPEARPLPVRIREVRALPDESALVFGLPRVRGKDEGLELVAEMVGNRWNAVVVGHRTRVIRHVLLPREDRFRSLVVGERYEPPPSTGRQGLKGELSEEDWKRINPAAGGDPEEARKLLLRGVAWTSSLNVPQLTGPEGRQRWKEMLDPERWGAFLLHTPRGAQPYPVALEGIEADPVDSLLEAFQRAREADEETGPSHELLIASDLLDRGRRRIRNAEGKVKSLRRQLDDARDPEPVRAIGDLILARFAEIPRGVERVVLTDFAGDPVEVELDPTLPPHENAARFYDEAARLSRARELLPDRIEKAEREVREWTAIVEEVREGSVPPGQLATRLGPATRGGERKGRTQGRETLPYVRFTSSGGLEIRVGKGARKNDDLTFRHSAPEDVWLHVRQSPGAHVILRWGREGNPPKRDLVEAAVLAALNSEARHSGSVPVDWTQRKYVRKPRKAPPGAVLPDRVQTLFVEPDPDLPKRLRGDD